MSTLQRIMLRWSSREWMLTKMVLYLLKSSWTHVGGYVLSKDIVFKEFSTVWLFSIVNCNPFEILEQIAFTNVNAWALTWPSVLCPLSQDMAIFYGVTASLDGVMTCPSIHRKEQERWAHRHTKRQCQTIKQITPQTWGVKIGFN